jgi:hypothetical protein
MRRSVSNDEEDPVDLTMHASNGELRLKPLLISDDGRATTPCHPIETSEKRESYLSNCVPKTLITAIVT